MNRANTVSDDSACARPVAMDSRDHSHAQRTRDIPGTGSGFAVFGGPALPLPVATS